MWRVFYCRDYDGRGEEAAEALLEQNLNRARKLKLEIVRRSDRVHGFTVLPKS
jgi:hypothetical protein